MADLAGGARILDGGSWDEVSRVGSSSVVHRPGWRTDDVDVSPLPSL